MNSACKYTLTRLQKLNPGDRFYITGNQHGYEFIIPVRGGTLNLEIANSGIPKNYRVNERGLTDIGNAINICKFTKRLVNVHLKKNNIFVNIQKVIACDFRGTYILLPNAGEVIRNTLLNEAYNSDYLSDMREVGFLRFEIEKLF